MVTHFLFLFLYPCSPKVFIAALLHLLQALVYGKMMMMKMIQKSRSWIAQHYLYYTI
jgi:hypothetical protein